MEKSDKQKVFEMAADTPEYKEAQDMDAATLYDFMLKLIPAADCPSGCSKCCGQPVLISIDELETIAVKHGLYLGEYNRCPYLSDNMCGIYNIRPLTCRIFGPLVLYHTLCTEAAISTTQTLHLSKLFHDRKIAFDLDANSYIIFCHLIELLINLYLEKVNHQQALLFKYDAKQDKIDEMEGAEKIMHEMLKNKKKKKKKKKPKKFSKAKLMSYLTKGKIPIVDLKRFIPPVKPKEVEKKE